METNKEINLIEFINKLKRYDKRTITTYYILKGIYAALIIVRLFFLLFLIIKEPSSILDITSTFLFLLAFLIFYIIIDKQQKKHKNIDYSEPTYLLMKKIKKQYSYSLISNLWIILATIILSFSISLSSPNFLLIQIIYWSLMALSVLIGTIYWAIKRKPIKDKIEQLIKELEE